MVESPLQKSNAPFPILVTPPGIVMSLRPVQRSNTALPIRVTLAGMVTLVTPAQAENAESPMAVTGRPAMVAGMVTGPAPPMYRVMVTVPLLTA